MAAKKRGAAAQRIATADEWGSSSIEDFHNEQLAKGLTHDLPLPSGKTIVVTRPPLMEWVAFGQVPDALTRAAYDAADKNIENFLQQADFKGVAQMAKFVSDVVQWAVIRPRIKVGAKGPNEIEPSRVPKGDLLFLLDWIKKGCPEIPVMTTKGAVSVASLETFRKSGGRKRVARPRRRVQDVRPGAQR